MTSQHRGHSTVASDTPSECRIRFYLRRCARSRRPCADMAVDQRARSLTPGRARHHSHTSPLPSIVRARLRGNMRACRTVRSTACSLSLGRAPRTSAPPATPESHLVRPARFRGGRPTGPADRELLKAPVWVALSSDHVTPRSPPRGRSAFVSHTPCVNGARGSEGLRGCP